MQSDPAGIWRVGPALDPRIEGQKALVALDGQRVIAPGEEKFYPAIESLRWQERHLTTRITVFQVVGAMRVHFGKRRPKKLPARLPKVGRRLQTKQLRVLGSRSLGISGS